MTTICTSNLTSGFVDLATYDELEKYMYGGEDATTYFVRETRKSTWFTQVPVCLSKSAGAANFGNEWSSVISRAGDYLTSVWLRAELPAITLSFNNGNTQGTVLRWTRNVGHNLIREAVITFNDLVAARFDSFHLDFWAAFTTPADKRVGYNNMIGNTDELVQYGAAYIDPAVTNLNKPPGWPLNSGQLPARHINVPLPFFFTRDSGISLPTAALPYNDMRITVKFRDWNELLVVQDTGRNPLVTDATWNGQCRQATLADISGSTAPTVNAYIWANYAIVSNDERKRMACAPRDILIEQVQTAPLQAFIPRTTPNPQYDIRFSHAIKVLFFAARNKTLVSDWSNYSNALPRSDTLATGATGVMKPRVINLNPADDPSYNNATGYFFVGGASDPIQKTSLVYENTARLSEMGSDYFSLVNPWYCAPTIPDVAGYHSYSYSLDFFCLDPMGSTNYGKLTNVSIAPIASTAATNASNSDGTDTRTPISVGGLGTGYPKTTYEFITTVVNNNIIRVSGGALGFPVL